ncbi:MAG: adenylate/guanylate cyclase domain-containing protein [Acidimicrobiales bacterium]
MGDGSGLTFLFTDVEGSTRLWEVAPREMRDDLARHDALLASAVAANGGTVFKFRGDGIAAVFDEAEAGVAAAVAGQRSLDGESWGVGALRVRMGLHSGPAEARDGDWYGPTVNRTARLQDVAHGGQIVVSGTTAQLVTGHLPPGVDLLDLGEHRLRDLLEPEHIHQVVAPDLTSRFSPLRTAHHPSRGVPSPTGRLLGRAVDSRRLGELVQHRRVVTITGPPGSGKTRLAVELARDERDRWSGGIWFCSLTSLPAGARGATGVASRLADLLGTEVTEGTSLSEVVVASLAGRRALVVLDGCEHVVDDAAEVAAALEAGCPEVVVVATSRERLDVPSEHLLELSTLDEAASVQLFVERAQAVRATFDPANHTDALRSLVGHLDGLPLAIELAAARVRTHAPDEIDRLLAEHVRVLRVPHRRQRSADGAGHHDLDAAISWSYDLLAPNEQQVFRHLAVFAGTFASDDVAVVVPGTDLDDVTDVLDSLVERSLVAAAAPQLESRVGHYRLLSTLRSFAVHRLDEAGAGASARERHASRVVARVEAAAARLIGPDEARWVAEIASIWDDLRAVHRRACDEGDVERAARIVAALVHHSAMRRLEVGAWGERTLVLPGFWDRTEAPLVASATAEVRLRRSDADGAHALALEAVERAGGGPRGGPWLAHSTLMLTTYFSGDFREGARRQKVLREVTSDRGDTDPLGPAVAGFLAVVIAAYGGVEEAAEPALALLEEVAAQTRCPSIQGMARLSAGRLLQSTDPPAARTALRDALELALSVDNSTVAAQARWALADLTATDDPAGALAELRSLLAESRAIGDDGELQQVLLRSFGPLVSLELDHVAVLVAGLLEDTVWRHAVRYLAGLSRLAQRTSGDERSAAVVRARALGLSGIVDEVIRAVDAFGGSPASLTSS